MDEVEAALEQLRRYSALREQLEQMTPAAHRAVRTAHASGRTKAEIARASGLSRPWIDRIIDEGR